MRTLQVLRKILFGLICLSILQSCGNGILGDSETPHPSQRLIIKDENTADISEAENNQPAKESVISVKSPNVLGVNPQNDSKDVIFTLNEISITFDKAMLSSSINQNTFQISRPDQSILTGSFSYNETDNVASFFPDATLLANEEYSVEVNSQVKAVDGTFLKSTFVSRFFTALPTISVNDVVVSEASGTAIIEVVANPVSAVEMSVSFSTQDASAISPDNFAAVNGTLVFVAGETNKTISVSIEDNVLISNDTQFYINLFDVRSAVIDGEQTLITILNDDVLIAPQLSLKNGDKKVTLSWSGVADATSYNVYYAKSSGVSNNNYVDLNGTTLIGVSSGVDILGLTNGVNYYFVVTVLAGSVESLVSNQAAAQPRATASIQPTLNDTGIVSGGIYPEGNFLDCKGTTVSEQDCSYGRDFTENDNSDGHAGFSYTKLDTNNVELSSNAVTWDCVRDNTTGLIWEVKTDDNLRRDASHTYAWYNTTGINDNGFGSMGDIDYGSCFDSGECNTENFTKKVNSVGFCGFNDWRLPNKAEMRSLINLATADPSIDITYFPNTISGRYWTSSPVSKSSTSVLGSIWIARFENGSTGQLRMDFSANIRLVRGGG